VGISGKQAAAGFAVNELKNSNSATINIISDVGFTAKALYYSGAFTNTGSIPPSAEQATTYTIVWTLSNTANSISNAKITSTLPLWVSFGGLFLPANENFTYNANTKEIVWNVDRIPRGAGIDVASRSISFQITLSPSTSQIGTAPRIINDATLTGHDDFANVDVKVNKVGLDTNLSNDDAFPPKGGIVK
jgi:hypothetical protein